MNNRMSKFIQIIINADDYGLNSGVNTAIINLMRKGVVTSTSVLANYITDSAARELVEVSNIQNISIGLHLNLVEGQPVYKNEKGSTIVNRNGYFFSPAKLIFRCLFGFIDKNDVTMEFDAQLSRLKDVGLNISHVDSHMHAHMFPFISKIISTKMKEKNINKVRCTTPTYIGNLRMLILILFSYAFTYRFKNILSPVKLITYFSNKRANIIGLVEHIANQPENTYELMVHPSVSKSGDVYDSLNEYEILNREKFKSLLNDNMLLLISFNDLS